MLNLIKSIIPIFVCCFIFAASSNAQDFQKTNNAVASYFCSVSNEIVNQIDTYTPLTSREKEQIGKFQKQLDYQIEQACLDTLMKKIGDKVNLMPLDALESVITYTAGGYPSLMFPKKKIKKVGKEIGADHYFVFNISVSPVIGLAPKLVTSTKPEVVVTIKIFDNQGNKVNTIKMNKKAKKGIKRIDFARKKFDKLDLEYVDPLVEKLMPTIEEAISMAVAKV